MLSYVINIIIKKANNYMSEFSTYELCFNEEYYNIIFSVYNIFLYYYII